MILKHKNPHATLQVLLIKITYRDLKRMKVKICLGSPEVKTYTVPPDWLNGFYKEGEDQSIAPDCPDLQEVDNYKDWSIE